MNAGDELLRVLEDATGKTGRIETPWDWIYAPATNISADEVTIHLRFRDPPSAGAIAYALAEVDRQARRTVTAMERQTTPSALFGRGVRLRPVSEGLRVVDARPGSLDVDLILGGLYAVVLSQPVSFVLNLVSLLQYGHVLVRVVRPNRKQEQREIEVAHTERPQYAEPAEGTISVAGPYGPISVPDRFEHVRVNVRTSDGTTFEFEAGP
jgi:hypothetical protein